MTIEASLAAGTRQLTTSGIGTARLDTLVLLEDITGKQRAWLLAHSDTHLLPEQTKELHDKLDRRANHEPIAYIRQTTEFYGRDFFITKYVLVPRPESETMIDLIKKLSLPLNPLIVDLGTGSGILGITTQLELPQATVVGTDIDSECIKLAKKNAKKHTTLINYYQGDLLEAVPSSQLRADYSILANLPYVPDSFTLNDAALNEPKRAIFGGNDGLDVYRGLFQQIDKHSIKPLHVLTESLPTQHSILKTIATQSHYRQAQEDDFIQVFEYSA